MVGKSRFILSFNRNLYFVQSIQIPAEWQNKNEIQAKRMLWFRLMSFLVVKYWGGSFDFWVTGFELSAAQNLK